MLRRQYVHDGSQVLMPNMRMPLQEGTLLLDGKSPQKVGYTQWRAQVIPYARA